MTIEAKSISELINELTEIREKHGDVPILINNDGELVKGMTLDIREVASAAFGAFTYLQTRELGGEFEDPCVITEEYPEPEKSLVINN